MGGIWQRNRNDDAGVKVAWREFFYLIDFDNVTVKILFFVPRAVSWFTMRGQLVYNAHAFSGGFCLIASAKSLATYSPLNQVLFLVKVHPILWE